MYVLITNEIITELRSVSILHYYYRAVATG